MITIPCPSVVFASLLVCFAVFRSSLNEPPQPMPMSPNVSIRLLGPKESGYKPSEALHLSLRMDGSFKDMEGGSVEGKALQQLIRICTNKAKKSCRIQIMIADEERTSLFALRSALVDILKSVEKDTKVNILIVLDPLESKEQQKQKEK